MRKFWLTLAILAAAACAYGQPPLAPLVDTGGQQIVVPPLPLEAGTYRWEAIGERIRLTIVEDGRLRDYWLSVTLTADPSPKPAPKPPAPKPAPTPTPTPVPVPTSGLHVLIVDDENLRGTLPQAQLNLFTSTKLTAYLDEKCAKGGDGEPAYRFSSNDSLEPGSEARRLELPVWVEVWDRLMASVKSGAVKLPAWAISNGSRGVIEALPANVDAAIARIKEFE